MDVPVRVRPSAYESVEMKEYAPLLVFLPLVLVIGFAPLILSYLLAPRKNVPAKYEPYECGFPPKGTSRIPFDVRYYLIALFFIIFDLETAFFFPWAASLRTCGWFSYVLIAVFVIILAVGFIYEWHKGALEWE